MPRAFVAIPLPLAVRERLAIMAHGLRGARWSGVDKLHLTLRFLGDLPGGLHAVEEALGEVRVAPFPLQLQGLGVFPGHKQPRVLWAGVEDPDPVSELHDAVDRALAPLDLDLERRHYRPHVTLARFRQVRSTDVGAFIEANNLFFVPAFTVDRFALFTSILHPSGSRYTIEAEFPLSTEP